MQFLEDLPVETSRHTYVSNGKFVKIINYECGTITRAWAQVLKNRLNLWSSLCKRYGNPLGTVIFFRSDRVVISSSIVKPLGRPRHDEHLLANLEGLFLFINRAHEDGWLFFDLAKKNLGLYEGALVYFDWEPFDRFINGRVRQYTVTSPFHHPDDLERGKVTALSDRLAALCTGIALLKGRSSSNEQFYRYPDFIMSSAERPLNLKNLLDVT
jgi:hypothetical protein